MEMIRRRRGQKATFKERALIDSQPEIDPRMSLCVEAWDLLESSRPLGLTPMPVPKAAPILVPFRGAIPFPAIRSFAELKGLGQTATLLLVDVIARLDHDRARREAEDIRRKAPR